jgi:hypothetical protein
MPEEGNEDAGRLGRQANGPAPPTELARCQVQLEDAERAALGPECYLDRRFTGRINGGRVGRGLAVRPESLPQLIRSGKCSACSSCELTKISPGLGRFSLDLRVGGR